MIHSDERVDIGILVENEVLRFGIGGILGEIPRIGRVHSCGSVAGLPPDAPGGRWMIIVTESEWSLADRYRDQVGGERPKILVIVCDEGGSGAPFSPPPADGFLLRSALSSKTLEAAILGVQNGEIPMPAMLIQRMLAPGRPHEAGPVRLTTRESQTVALLAKGLSNKQIARALGVSPHGAKRLVGSVLLKLGSPNRTAAVVTAIRSGLVKSA